MNNYLVLAAILCFLLGIVHSILGERMIFKTLKSQPSETSLFKFRGILWATWHLVTFFGFYMGLYLVEASGIEIPGSLNLYLGCVMFVGAILVVIGTKGRHPGWIILLLIALLVWIAG